MSLGAWLVVLFIVVPLIAFFVWALVRESVVRVPMGSLGLMVVQGKSTNRSLVPGVHWVPALRKRQCVSYPAVELSYRASTDPVLTSTVEAGGPALRVVLGDRAEVTVGYTVRFRLVPEKLKVVHDRFGTAGFWSAVRDDSAVAVAEAVAAPDVTVDSLYPGQRAELEDKVRERVEAALAEDGMVLTGFAIGAVDLGRAGETVQATVRARLELAREEAESAIQELRVRHDAELSQYLTNVGDTALRYRQTEVWRDLAHRPENVRLTYPVPSGSAVAEPQPAAVAEPVAAVEAGEPA